MLTLASLVTAGFSFGAINSIMLNVLISFLQGVENDEK